MSIGTNIKKLRLERDMTQETLAGYLGISVGAISQWECDRTCPDISQLPLLANVFDVTADEILGLDPSKNAARIKEIAKKADEFYAKADFAACAQVLRQGLKEHPRSYYLMVKLADSVTGTEEGVALSEKVISECTDAKLRNEAIGLAVTNHKLLGNTDQARKYAEMMPCASFSKEDLLLHLLSGKESLDNLRSYAIFCVGRLFIILSKMTEMKDEYDVNDRARLCLQRIALGETVFCDGDYNYSSDLMARAYSDLANIRAEQNDRDGVISSLRSAAKFRALFDSYDTSAAHTSPAVRGYVDGGWIRADGERSLDWLIDGMEHDPAFDFVRKDGDFKNLLESIRR